MSSPIEAQGQTVSLVEHQRLLGAVQKILKRVQTVAKHAGRGEELAAGAEIIAWAADKVLKMSELPREAAILNLFLKYYKPHLVLLDQVLNVSQDADKFDGKVNDLKAEIVALARQGESLATATGASPPALTGLTGAEPFHAIAEIVRLREQIATGLVSWLAFASAAERGLRTGLADLAREARSRANAVSSARLTTAAFTMRANWLEFDLAVGDELGDLRRSINRVSEAARAWIEGACSHALYLWYAQVTGRPLG
jgi:hypothetical protein